MRVLQHEYVPEGKPWPEAIESESWVFHVANRDDGVGLDIWWWDYEDDPDEGQEGDREN